VIRRFELGASILTYMEGDGLARHSMTQDEIYSTVSRTSCFQKRTTLTLQESLKNVEMRH